MTMGSKRAYNEWIDDYRTSGGRRWIKRYTVRQDRVHGKADIREQLEDFYNGIDPDDERHGPAWVWAIIDQVL